MYVGGICGVIGSFLYEHSFEDPSQMNAALGILIPLICCLVGSLLMGLLYSSSLSRCVPTKTSPVLS